MRPLSILVMCVLVPCAAWAISPHCLSLEQVLARPCRVAVCRIVENNGGATDHAHLQGIRFVIEGYAWGRGPLGARQGVYSAAYPYRMPDGKVEAPIHTGSGLEGDLRAGDRALLVLGAEAVPVETIWRAEPLSRRDEMLRLLRGAHEEPGARLRNSRAHAPDPDPAHARSSAVPVGLGGHRSLAADPADPPEGVLRLAGAPLR